MKTNSNARNVLYEIAARSTDPDALEHLPRKDATLIADHILAQPEATIETVFASHNKSVRSAAEELLTSQEKFHKATPDMQTKLGFEADIAHTRFAKSMAKANVNLDTLMKKTDSKLDQLASTKNTLNLSKTKMAVIGGAVALGAITAYALFRREHPEQTPDTQQR